MTHTAKVYSPPKQIFWIAILLVAAGALACRLPQLHLRPMHTDEAVQAYKTGILIDTHDYVYDPYEYHGPTLYYLTLPAVWLSGASRFADTTETTFRIVPVVFGAVLILLIGLLGDGLGRPAAVLAAMLTAISPIMVFYSRYYIQEMLLVFFTLGLLAAGWRYARSRRLAWAILAGVFAGLMHATKETSVIAFAATLIGIGLTTWYGRRAGKPSGEENRRPICPWHIALGALAGLLVAALFLTSFLTHPEGLAHSLKAYVYHPQRALGGSIHDHPWYYYLHLVLFTKRGPGPWWSEGFIIALALVGMVAALLKKCGTDEDRTLPRFLTFYTIAMTAIYAAIPYKTPWSMLSFFHGMILLAGYGAWILLRATRPRANAGALRYAPRAVLCLLLALGTAHLGVEAYRANTRYCADIRNPYVYAHSVKGILRLAERAEDIAEAAPEGHDMLIKVIAPAEDYWPVPWYLRRFTRVGYWSEVPENPDADMVIAAPQFGAALEKALHGSYQMEYHGLRPNVLLLMYIREDLWNAFMASRQ